MVPVPEAPHVRWRARCSRPCVPAASLAARLCPHRHRADGSAAATQPRRRRDVHSLCQRAGRGGRVCGRCARPHRNAALAGACPAPARPDPELSVRDGGGLLGQRCGLVDGDRQLRSVPASFQAHPDARPQRRLV